jgi:hypothetical protein
MGLHRHRTSIALGFSIILIAAVFVTADEPAPATAPTTQPGTSARIDPVKLGEVLPAKLVGLDRGRVGTNSNSPDKVSRTQAVYRSGETGPSVQVEISDYVENPSLATNLAGSCEGEMDYHNDDGSFAKQFKFKGYPTYEGYDTNSGTGILRIWVANRFFVDILGEHMKADDFKKVKDDLPLAKLASLK